MHGWMDGWMDDVIVRDVMGRQTETDRRRKLEDDITSHHITRHNSPQHLATPHNGSTTVDQV